MNDDIKIEYDVVDEIGQALTVQVETCHEMLALLKSRYEPLVSGGWQGVGAEAFFDEIEVDIFPSCENLIRVLDAGATALNRTAEAFSVAEMEAAGQVDLGGGGGGDQSGRIGNGAPEVVPPRIYVINGIRSEGNLVGHDLNGNPMVGDDQSVDFEGMFEAYGYDPDNVTSTPAIYVQEHRTDYSGSDFGGWLSPVDWVSGGFAWGANKTNHVRNALDGANQTIYEYDMGANGSETQATFDFVAADLERNPLLPGQEIVFVAHSGGGAPAANLSGMVENQLGHEVSAVVTMGSPVSNYDHASQYADIILDINHKDDWIGSPGGQSGGYIRTDGPASLTPDSTPLGRGPFSVGIHNITTDWGRGVLGTTLATEGIDRITGGPDNVVNITLQGDTGNSDAHGSYMNDSEASVEMMYYFEQHIPGIDFSDDLLPPKR